MKRLEVICDAVAHVNGYYEPESRSYELRNPGLLSGDAGHRIFNCHRAGYAALLDRVLKHCTSHPEDRLETLFAFFGIKMRTQQEHALDFMARCANSSSLNLETRLLWFIEEDNGRS